MSSDTEFLYPGESSGSESLKVVRLARRVREMRIKEPRAHVAVVGLLSSKILFYTTDEMENVRGAMKDMLWSARMKLFGCGLGEDAVRVYVPYKCVPIESPGQVVLYALNFAPRPAAPYMWDRQPKIQAAVRPELEASFNMEYDTKAREEDEKHNPTSYLTCQVEVAIWDAKTNVRRIQAMPGAKLSLKVGANSVEEVTGELTALKLRLRDLKLGDKIMWGSVSKVEIAFKGEAGVEFVRHIDKDRVEGLFRKWQAKMKITLAVDLQIPGTNIKLPIEISPYIDNEGKAGVQFQLKILDW
jgi:hypothetical protein